MGVSQARLARAIAAGNADISPMIKAEMKEKAAMRDVKDIELSAISFDKNVRTVYDEQYIKDLAQSIEVHGVMQPICVHEDPEEPCHYIVKLGHQRVLASRLTTRTTIPAFISTKPFLDMDERRQAQLVENIARNDLVDRDIEAAIGGLIGDHPKHGDYSALARRLGKDQMYVTRFYEAWTLRRDVDEQTRALIVGLSTRTILDMLHSIPNQGDYAKSIKAFENIVARKFGPVMQDPAPDVVPEVVPSKGAAEVIEDATAEIGAQSKTAADTAQDVEHQDPISRAEAIAPGHATMVMPIAQFNKQARAAAAGEGRATPEPAGNTGAKAATAPQRNATPITEWQVSVILAQGMQPKIRIKSMTPGWDIPDQAKALINDACCCIEDSYTLNRNA